MHLDMHEAAMSSSYSIGEGTAPSSTNSYRAHPSHPTQVRQTVYYDDEKHRTSKIGGMFKKMFKKDEQ
ncbi:hypothetical protein THRCLA_23454 [Thraustotheca clavata]|uniref:Uncharacterized protein n=1 Tax=Thraustotheca clavata TaxID=74557 RepID=A0A1V9Y4E1_9STRA|nr:hypothetical protein THRCLA_23454 [Thraustotheca clavata]